MPFLHLDNFLRIVIYHSVDCPDLVNQFNWRDETIPTRVAKPDLIFNPSSIISGHYAFSHAITILSPAKSEKDIPEINKYIHPLQHLGIS